MATTLRDNNVLSLANRLAPAQAEASENKARQQEVMMHLVRDLQSSLELKTILSLFFKQVRNLMPMDGINYTHNRLDVEFSTENQGRHRVNYNLDINDGDLGLLVFSRNKRFREEELTALENLMSALFYPLRNALTYLQAVKQATTDSLTGTGNRDALNSALQRELDLAVRDKIPLSVIMFDFDYFKQFNDRYGHQCGDHVLRQVVSEIRNIVRKTDMIFRYGGEEFLMVLHKTSLGGAQFVAEKIRQHVEQLDIDYQGQNLKVTISAGAAACKGKECNASLIDRADKALYAAKRNGRNQVCLDASLK